MCYFAGMYDRSIFSAVYQASYKARSQTGIGLKELATLSAFFAIDPAGRTPVRLFTLARVMDTRGADLFHTLEQLREKSLVRRTPPRKLKQPRPGYALTAAGRDAVCNALEILSKI